MKILVVLLVGALFASGCGASGNDSAATNTNSTVSEKQQEDIRAKLAEAEAQIKKLQATVDELKAQLAATTATNAKPAPKDLPIRIKQREAPNNSGNILQIFNLSEQPLTLKVTMTNSTLKKSQVFDLVIESAKISGPVKEIGNREGWAINPGDIAELNSPGYAPQRIKF
jgi:hypothetical protein